MKLSPEALEKARAAYRRENTRPLAELIGSGAEPDAELRALTAAILAYEAARPVTEAEVERAAMAACDAAPEQWARFKEADKDSARRRVRIVLAAARGME